MTRRRLEARLPFAVRLCIAAALLVAALSFCALPSTGAGIAEGGPVPSVRETLDRIGLPTIYIYTEGGEMPTFTEADHPEGLMGATIRDNAYVQGYCEIANLGSGRAFASRMKVKVRGNTTARAAGLEGKQPYKLVLKEAVDLFGNGHWDKRFALLSSQGENLKTHLSFMIGQRCGMEWTPDCRFVNLVFNDEYRGLYLLASAVDGTSLPEHVGPNGFMIECDAYWWNEDVYFKAATIDSKKAYTVKYPEAERLTDARLQQIKDYMDGLGKDLKKDGESDLIDVGTFVAWIMARDITGEVDSGGANIYYYMEEFDADDPSKHRLHMGPLWDFDNTFRRDGKGEGKWSKQRKNGGLYFRFLFNNEAFSEAYNKTWEQVSSTLYEDLEAELQALIGAEGEAINASRRLNAERWGVPAVMLEEEAAEKLDWLKNRMAWIDAQLAPKEGDGQP